jgi:hypothetical protein
MKRPILLIPLFIIIAINAYSQGVGPAALNTAGGTVPIGSNEFDWSVGEMTMVSTFSITGVITVTQGVLQPAEVTEGVANTSKLQGQLQVFPNPASSEVNLRYSSAVQGTLAYKLVDVTGKAIKAQTIAISPGVISEQVNVSELPCATYMLEVIINPENAASEKASYKIQKLQ